MIHYITNGREPWKDRRILSRITARLKALKVQAVHTCIIYNVHGFSDRSADRQAFSGGMIMFCRLQSILRQHTNHCEARTFLVSGRTRKNDLFLSIETFIVVEKQRMIELLSLYQTA